MAPDIDMTHEDKPQQTLAAPRGVRARVLAWEALSKQLPAENMQRKSSHDPTTPANVGVTASRKKTFQAAYPDAAGPSPPRKMSFDMTSSASFRRDKLSSIGKLKLKGGHMLVLTSRHISVWELSEQCLLKAGLRRLREGLVAGREDSLLVMPTRPNGRPLLMQASFFVRLLRSDVELKSCTASDVSAAQRDLKHLDCDQLLTLRTSSMEFSTDSDSHSAHKNFIISLDNLLFDKLALRCLRGSLPCDIPEEGIFSLSRQIALIAGGYEVACEQEARKSGRAVPVYWAIPIDPEIWNGTSMVLFHSTEFWFEVLVGGNADLERLGITDTVGVITSRSVVTGRDHRLDWRIALLNPIEDDVLAEVEQTVQNSDVRSAIFAQELSDTLKAVVVDHDMIVPSISC